MTLCAAWIRHGQSDEGQELVFATDSRLRMGESWDMGLKLFNLGRSDCLLCFAGETQRAYPLILQGSNSRQFNVDWADPRLDLYNVLDSLCELFTLSVRSIRDLPRGVARRDVGGGADFLFGGWSWRKERLCVWKITYSPELEAYVPTAMHDEGNAARLPVFIGDHVQVAVRMLKEDLDDRIIYGVYDMEPLRVLARMSLDNAYPEIGGALQVGKVYRSGNNEFFGMMWPSSSGEPWFLGRKINPYDAPPMRFIDPETTTFVEGLPQDFDDLDSYNFLEETQFVQKCYPQKKLDPALPEAYRNRLKRIFRDVAYREFVLRRETAAATASQETDQLQNPESADDRPADEEL